MKKDFLKTMLFMLCALCAFSFTACSDDDPADAASQVAGAYSGTLEVFMEASGDKPLVTDSKTISLSKVTNTSVNLQIQNFSLTVLGMTVDLGTVTISNCVLTESGNGYAFSGSVELKEKEFPAVGKADCKVDIANATVVGNTLTLPLVITVYQLGTTTEIPLGITANFTGTK